MGTQGYAAPEQYGGQGQTDARTDIYCLGATMYHLVTGHNPCTPPYEMYPIRQWNPMLSSGLEEIILKCIQKNPNDRYQSCAELLYALDHYTDLDVENKKVQNFKWKTFMTTMIIMIVTLIGTIGFGIALSATTASTYDALILNAQSQTDDKKAVEIYKQAIDIRPTDVRAYSGLLDLYGQDSTLSQDENKVLTEILEKNSEQLLRDNGAEFADEFVYPYSQYLFFAYASSNSIDGKVKAKPWLEVVENNSSDDSHKSRASVLKTLSNSFSNLGKTDVTGDSEYSYAKYWNDLREITSPSLAEDENITVALSEYKFVILEMFNRVDSFAFEGVTKDDYDVMMDDIEQGLQNIENSPTYISNKSQQSSYNETIKIIRKKIMDIKRVYTNNFGGQAGE